MHPAPFVEELGPVRDPWLLARIFADLPHLLFFDSSDRHSQLGRYSFISADPVDWIERSRIEFGCADPLEELKSWLARHPMRTTIGLPPFQGGLAGMFGYGLGHAIERFNRPCFDEFQVPDLAAGIYDWVIAFDHLLDRAWLVAHSESRFRFIRQRLAAGCPLEVAVRATSVPPQALAPQFTLASAVGVTSNFSQTSYLEAVRRGVEFVHAGDCFQVNIAQRLLAPMVESPLDLYGRLRECNPAPFAGYLDIGEFAIASASPERFLHLSDGQVESRPIKGTRPRRGVPAEDSVSSAELAAASKDRAENVMIVDLLRNDLGRVCKYGSVQVPRVCEVESYRYVHHLVSVVTGRLRDGQSAFDLLRAAFPGGSVTGAPKVRALQIISELEPTERGPYCGCLGYVGFDGAMDMNILIRTFTIGKGWVQFPVGGGIVADSNPQREYEETLHKAAGLLAALKPVEGGT